MGDRNTIVIPDWKEERLRKQSELLNTLMEKPNNNSNSIVITYNTFSQSSINGKPILEREQFEALREAIEDGYVRSPKQRNFIRNYFHFKSKLEPNYPEYPGYGKYERQPKSKYIHPKWKELINDIEYIIEHNNTMTNERARELYKGIPAQYMPARLKNKTKKSKNIYRKIYINNERLSKNNTRKNRKSLK